MLTGPFVVPFLFKFLQLLRCNVHSMSVVLTQRPPTYSNRMRVPSVLFFSCSTNGREARNRAEKNRRDKLNGAIQDLALMVPHVADSARRVDKTAILRLAAHGFRLNHVFKNAMGTTDRSAVTESFLQMIQELV